MPIPEIPPPPWKTRSTSKHASASERKGASLQEGGRRQPASGAFRHRKGDIITPTKLIEDKITVKPGARSYKIEAAVLEKTAAEALSTPPGHIPEWRFTIGGKVYRLSREEDALYKDEILAQFFTEQRAMTGEG